MTVTKATKFLLPGEHLISPQPPRWDEASRGHDSLLAGCHPKGQLERLVRGQVAWIPGELRLGVWKRWP